MRSTNGEATSARGGLDTWELTTFSDTRTKGAAARPELPPGLRIGPYEIEREIGRGGMGTVYLAFRADDAFEKKVAIKVTPGALGSPEAVERFKRERQILARLEHPNIARLLDGGATEEGLPYLVMEYIEGARPLHAYCDEKRLPTAARLKLFLAVCAAVEYAHHELDRPSRLEAPEHPGDAGRRAAPAGLRHRQAHGPRIRAGSRGAPP